MSSPQSSPSRPWAPRFGEGRVREGKVLPSSFVARLHCSRCGVFAIVLAVFIAFAFRDVLSVPGFRDVLWGLLLEEPQSRLLSLNAGVGIEPEISRDAV